MVQQPDEHYSVTYSRWSELTQDFATMHQSECAV